jgi:hypothetical protein
MSDACHLDGLVVYFKRQYAERSSGKARSTRVSRVGARMNYHFVPYARLAQKALVCEKIRGWMVRLVYCVDQRVARNIDSGL